MLENNARGFGEAAIATIERQAWVDTVADGLQKAVTAAFAAGGETGRRLRDFLHGTWLGHPLHPVLTDVPLGAWTTALVLDAVESRRDGPLAGAADGAIAVGLAGAVGAAVTGLTDWHHTAGGDRRVGLTHGLLNTAAVGLYATALLARRRGARGPGRALAGAGFLVTLGAAYLGGHLVFRRRVGVDHAPRLEAWPDYVAVLAEAELQESVPRRVEARGVAIALVRRDGRVYALADRCAHLGGPLSEGRLEGDSLRCPWHGSRFALEGGRLIEGPSTFPQSCFAVRIRNGQIEVRPGAADTPARPSHG
jgi:nitrite reductase/ring-hydroxylating ferredoxin subunit/uncharacterized membrane protein